MADLAEGFCKMRSTFIANLVFAQNELLSGSSSLLNSAHAYPRRHVLERVFAHLSTGMDQARSI